MPHKDSAICIDEAEQTAEPAVVDTAAVPPQPAAISKLQIGVPPISVMRTVLPVRVAAASAAARVTAVPDTKASSSISAGSWRSAKAGSPTTTTTLAAVMADRARIAPSSMPTASTTAGVSLSSSSPSSSSARPPLAPTRVAASSPRPIPTQTAPRRASTPPRVSPTPSAALSELRRFWASLPDPSQAQDQQQHQDGAAKKNSKKQKRGGAAKDHAVAQQGAEAASVATGDHKSLIEGIIRVTSGFAWSELPIPDREWDELVNRDQLGRASGLAHAICFNE
ncbi:hypothetical protein HK105_207629 [Polyrhizophydium stewartii]|uniref:Uncharacterized protein n=2 Tax=Polyrhizophydium stewartii TaxID=2732419 RepID=A0ABR4MZY1_9FUNG